MEKEIFISSRLEIPVGLRNDIQNYLRELYARTGDRKLQADYLVECIRRGHQVELERQKDNYSKTGS